MWMENHCLSDQPSRTSAVPVRTHQDPTGLWEEEEEEEEEEEGGKNNRSASIRVRLIIND